MSVVKVQGNPSGTGAFTIAAPATNTDRTLTLPDEAGTVLVNGTNSNVGIGTSSPNERMTIVSSTAASYIQICDSSTGTTSGDGLFLGSFNGNAELKTKENLSLAFGTNNTERARIDSSGNLLVGTTGTNLISGNTVQITSGQAGQLVLRHSASAAGKGWRLGPDTSGNNLIVFNQNGAGVYIADGGTAWTGTSDERVKDIIEPITGAIEKLSGLRTVIGKYKTDEEGTRRSFLIAQDVQAVFPEAVHEKDDELGTLGLAYTDMIPVLVKAIQEQQALINDLTARIAALDGPSNGVEA